MSDIIGTISAGRLTGSVGSTGNVAGTMSGGISRIGNSRDYNVLQVYILVVVLWMFFVHLILNLVLKLLNVRGQS